MLLLGKHQRWRGANKIAASRSGLSAYDAFGVREGNDSDLDDSDDENDLAEKRPGGGSADSDGFGEAEHKTEQQAEGAAPRAGGEGARRVTRRQNSRGAEIEAIAGKLDEVRRFSRARALARLARERNTRRRTVQTR